MVSYARMDRAGSAKSFALANECTKCYTNSTCTSTTKKLNARVMVLDLKKWRALIDAI